MYPDNPLDPFRNNWTLNATIKTLSILIHHHSLHTNVLTCDIDKLFIHLDLMTIMVGMVVVCDEYNVLFYKTCELKLHADLEVLSSRVSTFLTLKRRNRMLLLRLFLNSAAPPPPPLLTCMYTTVVVMVFICRPLLNTCIHHTHCNNRLVESLGVHYLCMT